MTGGDCFQECVDEGPAEVIRTVAMHHKIDSKFVPDFYARKIVKWRWLIYPWAVMEDLTTLVGEMKSVPRDAAEIARRLKQEYGIQLSSRMLQDLCQVLEEKPVMSFPKPDLKS